MAKSLKQVITQAIARPKAAIIAPGQSVSLLDGGFWSNWFGSESSSGITVNTEKALRLSAVWSCVRLISEAIGCLPLQLYRAQGDGGRVIARDHGLYFILHNSPNAEMTAARFWQVVVTAMLLEGNAYCEIVRGRGGVVGLNFLPPTRMRLEETDAGRLRYFFTSGKGAEREVVRENMLHIPAFSRDGRIGLSAIRNGIEVLGSAMAAELAANATFKNGMMPTIFFKVDHKLNPAQREEFREYTIKQAGAANAGKSPVLEMGMSAEAISINPTDAQLLESRGFSIEEICRWFGVPPWMVGHTDKGSNWGTGLEQQMLAFMTHCLNPITIQIEQSLNKALLSPVDRINLYAEFNLEGFLRADSAARAAFYSQMTQNGIYSRNECRRRENLPAVEGGDQLTVQSNLIPLDKLGQLTNTNRVGSKADSPNRDNLSQNEQNTQSKQNTPPEPAED